MIVNIYFTNGMYEHGKLFIKSFRNYYSTPIVAITRDLSNNQIEELSREKFCRIENESIDYDKWAKKINVSVDKLLQMKKEVETGQTKDSNQPWKLLTACTDRVEALYEVVKKYHEDGVLHFDADTYVRNRIDGLFDIVRRFDVCIRQRPNDSNVQRRAVVSMIGFKGKKSVEFFDRWMYHLRKVDILNTPKGFDQITCWETIQELKDKMNIGNMRKEKGYPFISSFEEADADMWFGNCGHRGKKINKFWKDHGKRMDNDKLS